MACIGCAGEDYAIPGHNALVLESPDPQAFLGLFGELRAHPDQERAIRRAGRVTARPYRWPEIVQRVLVPRISGLAGAGADPSTAKAASHSGGEQIRILFDRKERRDG